MATPYDELLDVIEQSFDQAGILPTPYAFTPNWINNITRLNATNMNEIFRSIKAYIDTLAANVYGNTNEIFTQIVELSAGWKTSNADGAGEIFNNYDENQANADYSHAEGNVSVAGSKAFIVESVAIDEGGNTASITLQSVEGSSITELAVNDIVSLVYSDYVVFNAYTIQSIQENVITISGITESFNTSNLSMLFVYSKLTTGDTQIGIGSHAENQSVAIGDYSHAEGSSLSAGKLSHAQGNNTQALHTASDASGYKTKTGRINQSVVGELNQGLSNTLFEVGNGTEQDSIESRSNAFAVYQDGHAEVQSNEATTDTTLTTKKYVTDNVYNPLYTEIEKLRQLNEWLGSVQVTAAEYDKENNYAALQTILTDFVKNNTTPSRDPRNGDQITVLAADSVDPVPEYPEIWMFVEDEPAAPPSAGTWKFFSSLQQIVDATTTQKGLVQIGANINVEDGVISVDKLQWKIYS